MISVAIFVQTPSCRGENTPVISSRTELLLEDWSPHTTNCGRSTCSPIPLALRLVICRRRWSVLSDCSCERLKPGMSGLTLTVSCLNVITILGKFDDKMLSTVRGWPQFTRWSLPVWFWWSSQSKAWTHCGGNGISPFHTHFQDLLDRHREKGASL